MKAEQIKSKVILFYSSLIIGMICLLYIEWSVLLILFEKDGNLLTVVGDILALHPLSNAIAKFLSSLEINFYISLLMFISIVVAAILIEGLET